jgi:hypothetical protein
MYKFYSVVQQRSVKPELLMIIVTAADGALGQQP